MLFYILNFYLQKNNGYFFPLFFLIVGLGFLLINQKTVHLEQETRLMMDTHVKIIVKAPKEKASKAINLAFKRMQDIEHKLNPYDSESPLYKFNHQNIPITDTEIINVIKQALKISKLSEGAFDITTFSLTQLWGINSPSPAVPTENQINQALKNVGTNHLILTDKRIDKKNSHVTIDLGGIAKGYAVGEAIKVLKTQGISSAVIDAGGDIFALGKNGNKLWRIGVKNPQGENLLGYVEVSDLAVMGSGSYERYFTQQDKKYHHIFNPQKGYPQEGLTGVTVVYPDPTLGDALATALFVMGTEKALTLTEKIPRLEAILVAEDKIFYSSGLKDIIKNIPSNVKNVR